MEEHDTTICWKVSNLVIPFSIISVRPKTIKCPVLYDGLIVSTENWQRKILGEDSPDRERLVSCQETSEVVVAVRCLI